MKYDVALLFGGFDIFPRYGEIIPPEELWEDGAQVWGFIKCDSCGTEVDKAILLNGQYYCECCLEKKVQ